MGNIERAFSRELRIICDTDILASLIIGVKERKKDFPLYQVSCLVHPKSETRFFGGDKARFRGVDNGVIRVSEILSEAQRYLGKILAKENKIRETKYERADNVTFGLSFPLSLIRFLNSASCFCLRKASVNLS